MIVSEMRLVEAESSSTLELQEDSELQLHCIGESRSQPVWYHNGHQLDEFGQTTITVRIDTANNIKESVLMRTEAVSLVDGQYQCRDGAGRQADSDVLEVVAG